MSNTPRSGGLSANAFSAACAVGIDAGHEAFGLERDRHRGQDVAVVVDQRDHMAHSGSFSAPAVAQSD